MSYTPTDWKTGDVITAEKLNNMEQGILNAGGGGVLVMEVNYDAETGIVEAVDPYQPAISVLQHGKIPVLNSDGVYFFPFNVYSDGEDDCYYRAVKQSGGNLYFELIYMPTNPESETYGYGSYEVFSITPAT